MIAHEDKKDYLEAYQLNPILVATESNPIDFLRVESMNPWNAATRLTLYWKYRRGAFRDRWLLPLTLSGQGALSQSDVALLKQDVIVLQKLPGNSTLVFVDWTRGPNQDDFFRKCVRPWNNFEIHVLACMASPYLSLGSQPVERVSF